MVYWKYDSLVFSQDGVVIKDYLNKYNVTLVNDIYSLTWIAEVDDAGKYNCTCTTGGIQFPVWIKVPADKTQMVRTNTTKIDDTTEILTYTSQDVIDFAANKNTKLLRHDESVSYVIEIDANCTWPEVNRDFTGDWFQNCDGDKVKLSGSHGFEQIIGYQINTTRAFSQTDTLNHPEGFAISPVGCATKHAVTYRYKNVWGNFTKVDFDCGQFPYEKKGPNCLYTFEVDHYDYLADQEAAMGIICGKGPRLTTKPPSGAVARGINLYLLSVVVIAVLVIV